MPILYAYYTILCLFYMQFAYYTILCLLSGLEFIDILEKISSVQQEKSGVQMNQSRTINISRATAIACSAQYMR